MCIVICTLLLSCPARGAWVEMKSVYYVGNHAQVVPRKGRVG